MKLSIPWLLTVVAIIQADHRGSIDRRLLANTVDQSNPPPENLGDRSVYGNSSLFHVWRPKAHFIAPNGWMNDPMGLFQMKDGKFHAGYQSHPNHVYWGNISMGAAWSSDLVTWHDYNSWVDPRTLYPSQLYDITGVFDGSIIPEGWNGYPTIIYTSVKNFPVGWNQAETEYTETQSLAYSTDSGHSWTKLDFPVNPIISNWPAGFNTTGFRDPYLFQSPRLSSVLSNSTHLTNATGDWFLTISGGVRPTEGGRLYLYRQAKPNDWVNWTFLGPIFGTAGNSSYSKWSGNYGFNYETCAVTRLNPSGKADDDGSDSTALDVLGLGTEAGRQDHELHWPLWVAGSMSLVASNGSVAFNREFSGVVDFGELYASVSFPAAGGRQILVGWTYEDEEGGEHVYQRGYQGAFSLFRDLFILVTKNVDPNSPGLHDVGSWGVRNGANGSTSVVTVGQRIVPEITKAYRSSSKVSNPKTMTYASGGSTPTYVPFATQPRGRFYAISATLDFEYAGNSTATDYPCAGFRVLASDKEYTDVYYDFANESFNVSRLHSSLITSYNNNTDYGPLRLWQLKDGKTGAITRQSLNVTIIVDNSILEVYVNDHFAITSRVYPWLSASIGAGFLSWGGGSGKVTVSNVELWDGLLNAWPDRPSDTITPLQYDGPLVPWNGT
ncbi:hypothetical protein FRB93_001934 [Tulasnella sp. JGI-2019a]|nr:hypothetical protein FRB93_001934 [Tulasnella sp. JGI-2019a]